MKKFYLGFNSSKIKISLKDGKTIVDEKNRCVIHTIDWKLTIPCLTTGLFYIQSTAYKEELEGKAKGVAVCHPKDEFNREIGIRMARAIAENNAYTNASKALRKRTARLKSNVKIIEDQTIDFQSRANNVIAHNKKYCDKLIKKG